MYQCAPLERKLASSSPLVRRTVYVCVSSQISLLVSKNARNLMYVQFWCTTWSILQSFNVVKRFFNIEVMVSVDFLSQVRLGLGVTVFLPHSEVELKRHLCLSVCFRQRWWQNQTRRVSGPFETLSESASSNLVQFRTNLDIFSLNVLFSSSRKSYDLKGIFPMDFLFFYMYYIIMQVERWNFEETAIQ